MILRGPGMSDKEENGLNLKVTQVLDIGKSNPKLGVLDAPGIQCVPRLGVSSKEQNIPESWESELSDKEHNNLKLGGTEVSDKEQNSLKLENRKVFNSLQNYLEPRGPQVSDKQNNLKPRESEVAGKDQSDPEIEGPEVADKGQDDMECGKPVVSVKQQNDTKVRETEMSDKEQNDRKHRDPVVCDKQQNDPKVREPNMASKEQKGGKFGEPEVANKEQSDPKLGEPEMPDREWNKQNDPKVGESEIAYNELNDGKFGEADISDKQQNDPELGDSEVANKDPTDPKLGEPEVTNKDPSDPKLGESEASDKQHDRKLRELEVTKKQNDLKLGGQNEPKHGEPVVFSEEQNDQGPIVSSKVQPVESKIPDEDKNVPDHERNGVMISDGVKRHECTYPGCSAVFSRPYRLKAHVDVHKGKREFQCPNIDCQRAYSSNQHLVRHMQSHSVGSVSRQTCKCTEMGCEKEFSNPHNMKKHVLAVHGKKHPYVCEVCLKGFRKLNQLKTHEFEHTGVSPFRCELCNLGFTTRYQISRHMRGHRKYTCEECGIEFTYKALLRKHYGQEHPLNYICDSCGKEFFNKALLEQHIIKHMDLMDRDVFFCPYQSCSRIYFAKRNLTYHLRVCHDGQKPSVQCDICGKELYNKSKLAVHIAIMHKMPPKTDKKKKERKKRKDAGKPKSPLAAKLTGIDVLPSLSEIMLNQNTVTLDVNTADLFSENISETDQKKKLQLMEKQPLSERIDSSQQNGCRESGKEIGKENLHREEMALEKSKRKRKREKLEDNVSPKRVKIQGTPGSYIPQHKNKKSFRFAGSHPRQEILLERRMQEYRRKVNLKVHVAINERKTEVTTDGVTSQDHYKRSVQTSSSNTNQGVVSEKRILKRKGEERMEDVSVKLKRVNGTLNKYVPEHQKKENIRTVTFDSASTSFRRPLEIDKTLKVDNHSLVTKQHITKAQSRNVDENIKSTNSQVESYSLVLNLDVYNVQSVTVNENVNNITNSQEENHSLVVHQDVSNAQPETVQENVNNRANSPEENHSLVVHQDINKAQSGTFNENVGNRANSPEENHSLHVNQDVYNVQFEIVNENVNNRANSSLENHSLVVHQDINKAQSGTASENVNNRANSPGKNHSLLVNQDVYNIQSQTVNENVNNRANSPEENLNLVVHEDINETQSETVNENVKNRANSPEENHSLVDHQDISKAQSETVKENVNNRANSPEENHSLLVNQGINNVQSVAVDENANNSTCSPEENLSSVASQDVNDGLSEPVGSETNSQVKNCILVVNEDINEAHSEIVDENLSSSRNLTEENHIFLPGQDVNKVQSAIVDEGGNSTNSRGENENVSDEISPSTRFSEFCEDDNEPQVHCAEINLSPSLMSEMFQGNIHNVPMELSCDVHTSTRKLVARNANEQVIVSRLSQNPTKHLLESEVQNMNKGKIKRSVSRQKKCTKSPKIHSCRKAAHNKRLLRSNCKLPISVSLNRDHELSIDTLSTSVSTFSLEDSPEKHRLKTVKKVKQDQRDSSENISQTFLKHSKQRTEMEDGGELIPTQHELLQSPNTQPQYGMERGVDKYVVNMRTDYNNSLPRDSTFSDDLHCKHLNIDGNRIESARSVERNLTSLGNELGHVIHAKRTELENSVKDRFLEKNLNVPEDGRECISVRSYGPVKDMSIKGSSSVQEGERNNSHPEVVDRVTFEGSLEDKTTEKCLSSARVKQNSYGDADIIRCVDSMKHLSVENNLISSESRQKLSVGCDGTELDAPLEDVCLEKNTVDEQKSDNSMIDVPTSIKVDGFAFKGSNRPACDGSKPGAEPVDQSILPDSAEESDMTVSSTTRNVRGDTEEGSCVRRNSDYRIIGRECDSTINSFEEDVSGQHSSQLYKPKLSNFENNSGGLESNDFHDKVYMSKNCFSPSHQEKSCNSKPSALRVDCNDVTENVAMRKMSFTEINGQETCISRTDASSFEENTCIQKNCFPSDVQRENIGNETRHSPYIMDVASDSESVHSLKQEDLLLSRHIGGGSDSDDSVVVLAVFNKSERNLVPGSLESRRLHSETTGYGTHNMGLDASYGTSLMPSTADGLQGRPNISISTWLSLLKEVLVSEFPSYCKGSCANGTDV